MQLAKRLTIIIFLSFTPLFVQSQGVGIVLSGGGASGFAHIGVLKALEENNIPINYITGTSSGALVGAMYASGYSPQEIEDYVLSNKFQLMSKGAIEQRYEFLLREDNENASGISFPFPSTVFSANHFLQTLFVRNYSILKCFASLEPAELLPNTTLTVFLSLSVVLPVILLLKKESYFQTGS